MGKLPPPVPLYLFPPRAPEPEPEPEPVGEGPAVKSERSALLPSAHASPRSTLARTDFHNKSPAPPLSPVQGLASLAATPAAGSHAPTSPPAPTSPTSHDPTIAATSPSDRADCRRVILWRHLGCALLQRMWEFAVLVLLTVVGPRDSFHLIATYGICVNLTVALLSPSAGALIDRTNRLRAVVAVTAAQNVCVVGCCVCFVALLWGHLPMNGLGWSVCIGFVHVGGSLNMLFQGLSNVILERDWVVVLAAGDDAWLRSITANLKAIDLSCNVVAPFLVSLLQMAGGTGTIAWGLSVGNFVMIYLQYTALHRIYHDVPALAFKEGGKEGSAAAREEEDREMGSETDDASVRPTHQHLENNNSNSSSPSASSEPSLRRLCQRLGGLLQNCFAHAHTYAQQRAFLPGLALAMLYLTVLTFHSTMLAYLLSQGLRVTYIALAQGGSSAMGVLGTLCYERVAARIGTVRVGVLAVWEQVACLTVAVGALYYPSWHSNSNSGQSIGEEAKTASMALGVFMSSIGLSRLGLNSFDVAAAQLFQYLVEEKVRGVVGGFQRTLESVFELLSYCLVLWRPRPEEFPSLAAISYFQVMGAAVVFTLFACRTQGGVEGLDEDRGRASEVAGNGSNNSSSSGGGGVELGGSGGGGGGAAALMDASFASSHHFEGPAPFVHNRFQRLYSSSSAPGEGEGEGEGEEGVERRWKTARVTMEREGE